MMWASVAKEATYLMATEKQREREALESLNSL